MNLARDGLTDSEIKQALHGQSGNQSYRFRYELQQSGARIRDLCVTEGCVSLDRSDTIQRGADLVINDSEINWLKNTIKIFMGLRVAGKWVEWPLGVFIPSTPTKVTENVKSVKRYDDRIDDFLFFDTFWDEIENFTWRDIDKGWIRQRVLLSEELWETAHFEVECYDRTVILAEDAFTDRYFVAAGTKYLDAVQSILVTAGIERVLVTREIPTEIPVDREWDIGISKLQIINTLLEEINYNPISCDADGNMILSPYIEPSVSSVSYVYAADEISVISPALSMTQDFYSVPNVFIAASKNPDLAQDFRSIYVNDNPASALSTVQRGRTIVSKVYTLDAVASQEDLDAYIRKQAFDANQIYEKIDFTTALMPFHGSGDVIALDHPAAKGIYQEVSWEMDLSAAGEMTHSARKLVRL